MIVATPPSDVHGPVLEAIVIGVGLVAPWLWLVVLDRLLRRTR